jgi:CRISPR-associated protein Csx14
MACAEIPVDLFNPGQVFACLGFLEAADVMIGDAEGGFDWLTKRDVMFTLTATGGRNPVEMVLEFLAEAEPKRWGPVGYTDPPPKKAKRNAEDAETGDEGTDGSASEHEAAGVGFGADLSRQGG